MITTPFATFANATVTLKQGSGNKTFGTYGNVEDTLTDYPVTCYLEQKKPPMNDMMNGSAETGIYVEGRCITPKILPQDIQPHQLGSAVFNGVNYDFRYQINLPSAFYSENEILGQKINGYLIRSTTWSQ